MRFPHKEGLGRYKARIFNGSTKRKPGDCRSSGSHLGSGLPKMSAKLIKQTIESLKIPKTTVAELASVSYPNLSAYFRDPLKVSAAKRARIESTVGELHHLLAEVFPRLQQPIPIKPDLRDVEGLKKLLDYLRNANRLTVNGKVIGYQTPQQRLRGTYTPLGHVEQNSAIAQTANHD